jgi:Gpi18-like mannosyltransferase
MKQVLVLVTIWLIVINIFALLTLNRINLKPDDAYSWIDQSHFVQNKLIGFFGMHGNWDGEWYLDIAKNGYSYHLEGLSNVAFFPLYPFLIRLLGVFGGLGISGWLISVLSLYGGAIFLYKIVKEFHPGVDVFLVIGFMLIFPTAFFFNAIYTESLYLFLSTATFYYVLKKNYMMAGVLGLFATLTRSTGILLFLPLLYQVYENERFRLNGLGKAWPLLLMPGAILLLFTFYFLVFKDFWLFFKIEGIWGRAFQVNQGHLQFASPSSIVNFATDIGFIVVILLAVLFSHQKLKGSYRLYMLIGALVPLSTGTTMSIGRYILPLFPVFILLAGVKNRYILFGWALASCLLLALYTTLFVNNYWAG